MKRLARLVMVSSFALLAPFAACECGAPPDDDGNEGEGEGEGNEGEGEAAGEGEGESPRPDAGIPDPNAVGIETRPANPTCVAADRPVFDTDVAVEEPWPNLAVGAPMLMLQEPGTNTMYLIERSGDIVRWDRDDANVTDPELFGDISDRIVTGSGQDERGLLGFAFHPAWPDVQEVYLSYTSNDGPSTDRVSRFTTGADGLLDEASEQILLDIDSLFGNHNGGMIAFSPTDVCTTCLYVGTGDGGFADDPDETAQSPDELLGKMLRIDVDGSGAGPFGNYGIPDDNPFVDVPGFAPEVYALGLRNPWRWSFDRETGDLWVGDVGQGVAEEVDLVEAGGNYGWDVFEGNDCHADSAGDDCQAGGFEEPIALYGHAGGRVAVIGGYVYRGTTLPTFAGTYLYAEHATGEVFALLFDAAGVATPEVVLDLDTRIASFSEDAEGDVYLLDHQTSTISRLVPAGPAPPDNFPTSLSATGCADPADPALPSSGLIPYGTAHSLYSDGAIKDRYMGLPDGTQATILEDGDIDFPVGTVFRKDFRIAGERIETRLLMRHDDGEWGGYSYEWNDDGTDATLLPPAGKTKTLANGQQWTYPSRNGCLTCHTSAARRVLGLELAQLNVGFVYPGEVLANQLTTLDHIELFDSDLPAPPADLPAFAPVDDESASAEDKARAYLHVNCAICHRPGGIGVADTDWRFETPLANMSLCNVAATEGNLGVDGAARLIPGDPARSLVSIRMKRLGAGRMPLLGSVVVDQQGTAVIDEWITSLQGCDP